MPPILEVSCENPSCDLDMFDLHFSYELAYANVAVEDFCCPHCGSSDYLEELTYTYRDAE